MENKIEHKFLYKNLKCVITYGFNEQLNKFYSNKMSVVVNGLEKSEFFDSHHFNTEKECKDFLIYQTKKFIDNNFKKQRESVKEYFLKKNSGLSLEEQKKVLNFFIETNKKFDDQLEELESCENENQFFEIYNWVRSEMINKRDYYKNLLDNPILIKDGSSVLYLRKIYVERNILFQDQMHNIEHLFRKKFDRELWNSYEKTNNFKEFQKTHFKKKTQKESNEIDWGNSKNTWVAIFIVIIIMLIFAFGSQNKTSNYDKTMRNSILENHDYKDGPIDCTGSNSQSTECRYLLNLPAD